MLGLLACASTSRLDRAIETREASIDDRATSAADGATKTPREATLRGPLVDPWDTEGNASLGAPDPRDLPLLERCGRGDAALAAVAQRVAMAKASAEPAPDVKALLRRAGVTDPWPQWLTLEGSPIDRAEAEQRVARWASGLQGGRRRCGVASVSTDRGEVISIVEAPRGVAARVGPDRIRVGAWATIEARIPDGFQVRSVTVIEPGGLAPRTIPFSVYRGELIARFAADHAGTWRCAITADAGEGPRPMANLELIAGTAIDGGDERDRDANLHGETIPGENESAESDPETLLAMLAAARRQAGRKPLERDRALDALATQHARAMAKHEQLGHDTGEGDPAERVQRALVSARLVGENVARAKTIRAAHRSLWESIGHRENLLSPRFTHVGVGVVSDDKGQRWAVELFVGR